MNEPKLASALAFLSLDSLSPFLDSLLITPSVNEWRQDGLRSALENPVRTQKWHTHFQSVCFDAYWSLQRVGKGEIWASVWNWVQSVYLFGGEDRSAERIWSLILARHLASSGGSETELPPELSSRLIAVQDEVVKKRARIVPIIAGLSTASLSEWDATLLPQIHLNIAFLKDKIDLISSYNQLVISWKSYAALQRLELCQLHAWGQKVGAQMGVREIDVCFPGSWEYGFPVTGRA